MQINAIQIILQIVNFAVLVTVLTKFLYKPILKILEGRAQRIQEGLEAAEKSLEERAAVEEKKHEILIKTERQAAEILDQARIEAKAAAKDIVAAAKNDAQEAVEKEYQILQSKIKDEELKIRQNIAELISKTTTTVLQGALTESAHRQIINSQINKLGNLKSWNRIST